MFAGNLISNEVFPLKKSDSCETAHMLMADFKVRQLPVVDNLKVVGFVTEQAVLDNADERVEAVMQTNNEVFCINYKKHFFEVLQIIADNKLSCVAVVDNEENFKGIIPAIDLPIEQHQNSALQQVGSIITLQMPAINYSLAELARIVESNDIKILHVFIHPINDLENHVQVSFKFNTTNLKYVKQSFDRFGYQIIYANNTDEDETGFNDRYNWLLKYINT